MKHKTALQQLLDDMAKGEQQPMKYYMEMEKQQIIITYNEGNTQGLNGRDRYGDDYYNETFTK